jgi:hypothetical protein
VASVPPHTGSFAPREPDILEWHNDALIALDELYEAAISGSEAAREKLRSLADNLIEAAGLYGRQIKSRAA